MTVVPDELWRFARGDIQQERFEHWLYTNEEVEKVLGPDLYLELISGDFGNRDTVWLLRQSVAEKIKRYRNCECPAVKDLDFIPMGMDGDDQRMFSNLNEILRFGPEKWWLSISRCKRCDTVWMIGQDHRYYDDYFFNRISEEQLESAKKGTWPKLFWTQERLLALGRDLSKTPVYVDPDSRELVWTIKDLLKERPSITYAEIAEVLCLPEEHVARLAQNAST